MDAPIKYEAVQLLCGVPSGDSYVDSEEGRLFIHNLSGNGPVGPGFALVAANGPFGIDVSPAPVAFKSAVKVAEIADLADIVGAKPYKPRFYGRIGESITTLLPNPSDTAKFGAKVPLEGDTWRGYVVMGSLNPILAGSVVEVDFKISGGSFLYVRQVEGLEPDEGFCFDNWANFAIAAMTTKGVKTTPKKFPKPHTGVFLLMEEISHVGRLGAVMAKTLAEAGEGEEAGYAQIYVVSDDIDPSVPIPAGSVVAVSYPNSGETFFVHPVEAGEVDGVISALYDLPALLGVKLTPGHLRFSKR